MTVFKHPRGTSFRYDFWYGGERYTGNTRQTTRADAELAEAGIKKALRLQSAGLLPPAPTTSPAFQDWAEVYLDHVRRRRKDIKNPERIEHLLRVVLRFWGRRPSSQARGKWAARTDEPYHDCRLIDAITQAQRLMAFEDWMARKQIAGQTKNQYRSVLSQMYALALRPAFRQETGVTMNPFVGVPRDRGVERTSTVSVEQLRAWLKAASYHVRLAVAIAALAPKLRLANVLALRWREIDRACRYITISSHKTSLHTGRPLVQPIGAQLATILQDAKRRRRPSARYVVTYRGRRVHSIRDGVRAAAEAAGLRYGRYDPLGVTFHTIRHTMATMLAELSDLDGQAPLSESQRMVAMGHTALETTQRYTHIRPTVEARVMERLSAVTPIADIVTEPWTRANRTKPKVGTSPGTGRSARSESRGKPADLTRLAKRSKTRKRARID